MTALVLASGSLAAASTLLITDGGSGNPYGDTSGFVVDFDASYSWTPSLIPGRSYTIDSISIWEASDFLTPNNTPAYLSVFDHTFGGFTGDTSASYLGHSDNAIDHTATPDSSKITYYFSNIVVTADDDGMLSGTGLVYFTWDDDTVRNNFGISSGVHPFQRIDSNPAAVEFGAAIYAFGAIQPNRVPEIEVSVTLLPVPEPCSLLGLLVSISTILLWFLRRA
jgi:hypothetical protein